MSVQRLTLSLPIRFDGLSRDVPPEIAAFAQDLERRLSINFQSLISELRKNALADPDVLPDQTLGESVASSTPVQVSTDVEQALLLSFMMV